LDDFGIVVIADDDDDVKMLRVVVVLMIASRDMREVSVDRMMVIVTKNNWLSIIIIWWRYLGWCGPSRHGVYFAPFFVAINNSRAMI
jgi:hypothetical protein